MISHHIIPVSSLDLPELQPYRTLRRQEEHKEKGIFVAEGDKVVGRLLDSSLEVISLLLTKEWYEGLHERGQIPGHVKVYVAKKDLLETIAGFRLHQGVMAVARVPLEQSLNDILKGSPSPHLVVALDGLAHVENVGVIVRNCGAFGVQAVIAGETTCSPYLRRAVRNSMGAVFRVPVIHADSLMETLAQMQSEWNMKLVVAHPHTNTSLDSIDFRGDVCVVFGSEDAGISEAVLGLGPTAGAIPMANNIDSLNVANASAAFLYEIQRQRRSSRPAPTPHQSEGPDED